MFVFGYGSVLEVRGLCFSVHDGSVVEVRGVAEVLSPHRSLRL